MEKSAVMKRVFALMILSMFVFSFGLNFVAGADEITFEQDGWVYTIKQKAGSVFGIFGDYEREIYVMYILGALILSMGAYIVLNLLPLGNLNKFSPLFALAIGILITLLFKPEELFTLMFSYKSAGLSFLTLAPILILYIAEIQTYKSFNLGRVVLFKILWIGYGIYLVIQWFSLDDAITKTPLMHSIFWISLVTIIIAAIGINMWIANWLRKSENKLIKAGINDYAENVRNLGNLARTTTRGAGSSGVSGF